MHLIENSEALDGVLSTAKNLFSHCYFSWWEAQAGETQILGKAKKKKKLTLSLPCCLDLIWSDEVVFKVDLRCVTTLDSRLLIWMLSSIGIVSWVQEIVSKQSEKEQLCSEPCLQAAVNSLAPSWHTQYLIGKHWPVSGVQCIRQVFKLQRDCGSLL